MTVRTCGGCTLCCEIYEVKSLQKGAHQVCQHACSGCKIHDRKPQECRDYVCAWLVNASFPDHWYPAKSHMVIDFNADQSMMRIHVDPAHPNCWQQEPYRSDIARFKEIAKRCDYEMRIQVGGFGFLERRVA